jgi:hypothetical protein
MNAVTAVIVTTSLLEQLKQTETYPAIEFINHRAREFASSGEFVEVSRWTRGKHPESLIFIAGLNFCDLGTLERFSNPRHGEAPIGFRYSPVQAERSASNFAPCEFPH